MGKAEPGQVTVRWRQLAKRVQFLDGALPALDHAWNDIVAPVTDGDLEHVEDLCRCEHRRPSQETDGH